MEFNAALRSETGVNVQMGKLDEAVLEADLGFDLYADDFNIGALARGIADFAMYQDRFDPVPNSYKREAYLMRLDANKAFGNHEITLGAQQIVWGESIYFNVANIVMPVDFRKGVLTDRTRYRLPVLGGRYQYATFEHAVDLAILFDQRLSKITPPGTIWRSEQLDPCQPFIGRGIRCSLATASDDWDLTANPALAFRYTRYHQNFDWSFFFFRGTNRIPVLTGRVVGSSSPSIALFEQKEKVWYFGITSSATLGQNQFGLETRYTPGQSFFNVSDTANGFRSVKPSVTALLTWNRFTSVGDFLVEYFHNTILNYDAGITQTRTQNIASLQYFKDFAHDTRQLSLRLLFDLNDQQTVLQPSFTFKPADSFHITLGADVFINIDDNIDPGNIGPFSGLGDNNRLYVRFSYFTTIQGD